MASNLIEMASKLELFVGPVIATPHLCWARWAPLACFQVPLADPKHVAATPARGRADRGPGLGARPNALGRLGSV